MNFDFPVNSKIHFELTMKLTGQFRIIPIDRRVNFELPGFLERSFYDHTGDEGSKVADKPATAPDCDRCECLAFAKSDYDLHSVKLRLRRIRKRGDEATENPTHLENRSAP